MVGVIDLHRRRPFRGGKGGLPARTQAVYQSELTNETATLIRSSATGAASFSKAGKNPGSK